MTTLRYTGKTAVSIPSLGLDLQHGDLFEAPSDVADELAGRADFKAAGSRPTETVEDVLARVGSDPAEAAKALTEEESGGKPRKSLVSALIEIIEAAPADPSEED